MGVTPANKFSVTYIARCIEYNRSKDIKKYQLLCNGAMTSEQYGVLELDHLATRSARGAVHIGRRASIAATRAMSIATSTRAMS